MELLYIWIEDYKNIKKQGFNFSPQYRFDYKPETGELTVAENPNHIPDFFPEGISNVTAIIGENGAGKSSLLEAIQKPYLLETILIFGIHDEKGIVSFEIEKEKSIALEKNNIKNQTKILFNEIYNVALSSSNIGESQLDGDDKGIEGLSLISYSPVFTGYYKEPSHYKNNFESSVKGGNSFNYTVDYQLSIKPLSQYKFEETQRQLRFINSFNDFSINKPYGIEIDILPHNKQFRAYDGINKDDSNIKLLQNIYDGDIVACKDMVDLFVIDVKWSYFFNISSIYFENIKFITNDNIEIVWKNMIDKKYKEKNKEKNKIPDKMDLDVLYNIINTDFKGYISKFYNYNKKVNDRNFRMSREQRIPADLFISLQNGKGFFDTDKFSEFMDFLKLFEEKMVKYFHNSRDSLYFLRFNWNGLSSGELSVLNLFSSLNSIFDVNLRYKDKDDNIKDSDVLLCLDEPDSYQHPDWSKKFIKRATDSIPHIYKNRKTQIILTSHSPFLASDLPNENIIFLEKDEKTGNCVVKDSLNDMKHTFGANIHTLLTDSFFMKDGLMGDFAKEKINEVIKFLNGEKSKIPENDNELAQKYIRAIGEPIIRNQLQKMLDSKRLSKVDDIDKIKDDIKKQQETLENLQNQLNQIQNNDTNTQE